MRVGSLFSGIGGLDLGLERAGMSVAWQCEIDAYCRGVLAHHWPGVPCYPDVRTLLADADSGDDQPRPLTRPALREEAEGEGTDGDAGGSSGLGGGGLGTPAWVDLICGGFPCQPVSLAGKGLAQEDPRWLWPEFARVVGLLRPKYVLIENVPGLLTAGKRQRDRCLCGWPLGRGGLHHGLSEGRPLVQPSGGLRDVGEGRGSPGAADGALRRLHEGVERSHGGVGSVRALEPARGEGVAVPAGSEPTLAAEDSAGSPGAPGQRVGSRGLERDDSSRGTWDQAADSGLEQEGADDCPSCGRPVDRQPQPAGFAAREVLQGLAALGYDSEWQIVSAASVGAPHLRERLIIVAYPDADSERLAERGERDGDEAQPGAPLAYPDGGGLRPHEREVRAGQRDVARSGEALADADGLLLDWGGDFGQGRRPELADGGWWLTEPEVGRVAAGVPGRVAQLRALGNAVVPQVAEFVGRLILEAEAARAAQA